MHNQSIAFTSLKTRESSQAKQQAMAGWNKFGQHRRPWIKAKIIGILYRWLKRLPGNCDEQDARRQQLWFAGMHRTPFVCCMNWIASFPQTLTAEISCFHAWIWNPHDRKALTDVDSHWGRLYPFNWLTIIATTELLPKRLLKRTTMPPRERPYKSFSWQIGYIKSSAFLIP